MLPPPAISGTVEQVEVDDHGMVLRFSSGPVRTEEHAGSLQAALASYMSYRGGVLRFGKLTMTDADLVIEAKQRPLDFFLDQYQRQLVASEVHVAPEGGLRVIMPGYRERRAAATAVA